MLFFSPAFKLIFQSCLWACCLYQKNRPKAMLRFSGFTTPVTVTKLVLEIVFAHITPMTNREKIFFVVITLIVFGAIMWAWSAAVYSNIPPFAHWAEGRFGTNAVVILFFGAMGSALVLAKLGVKITDWRRKRSARK